MPAQQQVADASGSPGPFEAQGTRLRFVKFDLVIRKYFDTNQQVSDSDSETANNSKTAIDGRSALSVIYQILLLLTTINPTSKTIT